jgi:hypothetical protein
MNLSHPIKHQTQPNSFSCVSTCIAMALGLPVAELGVPLDRGIDPDEFGPWLAERGIWLRPMVFMRGVGEQFERGCTYLVGVRSLNDMAQDHAILVDYSGEKPKLFDPNRGRPGKYFFSSLVPDDITCLYELRDKREGDL